MNRGNIVGEEFEEYVRQQIRLRQSAHGAGYGKDIAVKRTNRISNYLNNRTAWVKLASSVNVFGDGIVSFNENDEIDKDSIQSGEKRLRDIGLSNVSSYVGQGLAEKAVLFNGLSELTPSTYSTDENGKTTKTNGKYRFRSGVSRTNSLWTNKAYGLGGTEFGLQPMPGIVSADIKCKNRGSIRSAEVQIKAFNRFQFDIIEILYMRLGYTMMLEWGWDKFLRNKDGNIVNVGNTLIEDFWFKPGNSTSQLEMLDNIEVYREKYSGNYDAFFGKVTNFDWNFNPDGSYDITLSLITIGDIIESLSILKPVVGTEGKTGKNDNTLQNFLNKTKTLNLWNNNDTRYFRVPKYRSSGPKEKSNLAYIGNGFNIKPTVAAPEQFRYFIQLKHLLDLIRKGCIDDVYNSSLEKPENIIDIDTNPDENLMALRDGMTSCDPRICIHRPDTLNKTTLKPNKILPNSGLFITTKNAKTRS